MNISKIMNVIGTILIIFVIILTLPTAIPKMVGYKANNILTESMSNIYDVGTIVYLREVEFEEIDSGDVIGFVINEKSKNIAVHRIVDIDKEKQTFITKGDMNESNDAAEVSYQNVEGVVKFYLPIYGNIAKNFGTIEGKIFIGMILVVAIVVWIIAEKLRVQVKK